MFVFLLVLWSACEVNTYHYPYLPAKEMAAQRSGVTHLRSQSKSAGPRVLDVLSKDPEALAWKWPAVKRWDTGAFLSPLSMGLGCRGLRPAGHVHFARRASWGTQTAGLCSAHCPPGLWARTADPAS